ncbi:MAG: FAD-dependent oxidoreductase, partial [Candidatus Bathyarchaeota archaeon]|nr:FAD-dependent oxidoreductase [Candidatus Bathyarchaeota archaeon]
MVNPQNPVSEDGKVGSVLVVGGGIGGIQAALDLAESGFKVYVVDNSSAIGGVMARLDKTFPTNDCSMCILSPKLVECGRHLNVEVLTCSEVTGIAGEAGNLNISVRQRPRYVDIEKCTACGLCAKFCPVDAIDTFNKGLSERAA